MFKIYVDNATPTWYNKSNLKIGKKRNKKAIEYTTDQSVYSITEPNLIKDRMILPFLKNSYFYFTTN